MLGYYCNQNLILKIRTSTNNKFNEFTYTNTNINVRVVYKRSLFRNLQNEELLSTAEIYSEYAIKEGDKIIIENVEYSVQKVYPYVDFNGNKIGTKAIV